MTTATKSSFKSYIADNTSGNPRYTFFCICKGCRGKQSVKVEKTKVSTLVQTLGFDDMMTTKELDQMHHKIVQMFG